MKTYKNFKLFYVVLLTVTTIPAFAQLKIVNIKGIAGTYSEGDSFPLVRSTNPKIAEKINSYLQDVILGNEQVETDAQNIFKNAAFIPSDSFSKTQFGLSTILYKVLLNNAQVLSVKFDLEFSGATVSYYSVYFSFNVRTGEFLQPGDLFTDEGLSWLKKYLISERKKSVQNLIRETLVDYTDSIQIRETLNNCLAEPNEDQFGITRHTIIFYKQYCFQGGRSPLDTDLTITIAIKGREKYFTAEGRKLLGL